MEEAIREHEVPRVSWRGIWAGLFVVSAVEILMQLFGVAVGVSALNPRGDLSGVSLWTGIWAIISTLSAFFFGGWASAAIGAPLRRSTGVLTGVLVWAFVLTIATLFLTGAAGVTVMRIVPGGGGSITQLKSPASVGAAWIAFGVVLLSLGSSVLGGILGSSTPGARRPREAVYREPVTTPPSPTPPVTTY